MDKFLERLGNPANVESKIDIGNPYITITENIVEEAIDLVVMAPREPVDLRNFLSVQMPKR